VLPDLVIDSARESIDEEGWWKSDRVETSQECVERVKEAVKELKDIYRAAPENRKKVYFAITHGAFLSTLGCVFTNNIDIANEDFFIPENNSIAILDFEEVTQNHKTFVDCKLTAFNLKIKSPKGGACQM
jgi:broad specificity phosphatase PhoE